jgi:uncharacterized protein YrrD
VKDQDGNDLGKVDDLLMDPQENKVRFLVLASGGFLGIGETNSFIPVDAISRITPDKVHLDKNGTTWRQRLSMTPTSIEERDFYQNIYSYYGYASYWTPGYVYPAYPFPPR